jgi:hypothetical protein
MVFTALLQAKIIPKRRIFTGKQALKRAPVAIRFSAGIRMFSGDP